MKDYICLCSIVWLIPLVSIIAGEGPQNGLLTDPFLQVGKEGVDVVWFTLSEGIENGVYLNSKQKDPIPATTIALSRIKNGEERVWRHSCHLSSDREVSYQVYSKKSEQEVALSDSYVYSPLNTPNKNLKILLTSDHQNKKMVAANLAKVYEVVDRIDAIFFAGDLVDIPDDFTQWFDYPEGGGFFPCLQGYAKKEIAGKEYRGAPLIQTAPTFFAIGNHEVMGVQDSTKSLREQFNSPRPKEIAEKLYEEVSPDEEKEEWVRRQSFNTISYQELFSPPGDYYAVTVGNVRLIVLYATRIWRLNKFGEARENLQEWKHWGFGDFIFEPIHSESKQYEWLVKELESEEFAQAKYHFVMLHNPIHSLGANVIPPFTDPIQRVKRKYVLAGSIRGVSYSYPKEDDHLIRDIEPLLEKHGVDLVFCGHSHLWNRFQTKSGMHHLESSNVGNSFGAYYKEKNRRYSQGSPDCVLKGDPYGLDPIPPTISPLTDKSGKALPFIADNHITVFSIFDAEKGVIDSYYFDTRKEDSPVIKFDSFPVLRS